MEDKKGEKNNSQSQEVSKVNEPAPIYDTSSTAPLDGKKMPSPFGFLKDSVKIHGDIISPIDEPWEVERL
jgi:hypothetical protein